MINVFYVAKLGVSAYFFGILRYKKLKMSYTSYMTDLLSPSNFEGVSPQGDGIVYIQCVAARRDEVVI